MLLYFLLLLPQVRSDVSPTASSFLNEYKLYRVEQYLKETSPKPTKKGPILFPNDAPPPPKPPLIVTSRPLSESIARSELNTTVAPPEQRIDAQSYEPYFAHAPESDRAYPLYKLEPFANLNKDVLSGNVDFNSEPFPLPPIYNKIPIHEQQQSKYQESDPTNDYTPSKQKIKYIKYYSSNSVDENDNSDDNNNNYAFSYKVRDNKTGDDFSHSQHSQGSATSGEYRVRLPDGRTQIVSYTADENGYKADVRYDEAEKKSNTYTDNLKFDKNYDFQLNHNDLKSQRDYDDNVKHYYTVNDNNNKNIFTSNYKLPTIKHKDNYEFKNEYPKINVANNEYKFQSIYPYQNRHNTLVENNKYDFTGQSKIDTSPVKPVKEETEDSLLDDYGYADINKEYSDDDLDDIDYDSKSYDYAPHRDKFNTYVGEQTNTNFGVIPIKSTTPTPTKFIDPYAPRSVKPTYDELKPLFISTKPVVSPTKTIPEYVPTKNVRPTFEELKPLFFSTKPPTVFPTITYNGEAKVEHHVPSTTPSPNSRIINNDEVILIGGKPLYTNIKQSLKMFQEPVFYSTPKHLVPPVTPREFLVSTIAGIRDRLTQSTPRPILSQNFLDRINKYLKFV